MAVLAARHSACCKRRQQTARRRHAKDGPTEAGLDSRKTRSPSATSTNGVHNTLVDFPGNEPRCWTVTWDPRLGRGPHRHVRVETASHDIPDEELWERPDCAGVSA